MVAVEKCTTLIDRNTNRPFLVSEGFVGNIEGIKASNDIVELVENAFHASQQTEEHVWLLAMDVKHNPCGIFEVSHGNVDTAIVMPREVFLKALLAGASRIVLIHNHPTGDPSPSSHDIEVTKSIQESGKMLGICLVDHLVIGNRRFFSFYENKILAF